MYKLVKESSMPSFLKVMLYIVLTITFVYWPFLLIYNIIELVRKLLSLLLHKKVFWTIIICALIAVLVGLLLGQFYCGLDPFGKIGQAFVDLFNNIKSTFIGLFNK